MSHPLNDPQEHRRAKKVGGFTLAEMMVAITIFGIVAVLSVPGFNRLRESWVLRSETDNFATALRAARTSAVTKKTTTVFRFQMGMSESSYFFFEDDDGNGVADADEYQTRPHTLDPMVSIETHDLAGPILVFDSRGSASDSGTITLQNIRAATRSVSVFGGTGNITSQ